MADEATGQPIEGTAQQTTEEGTEGQVASEQTAGDGTVAEDSFFDPSTIKGTPLENAYKEMQRAWTQKTTERNQFLEAHKQKVEAYDNFMSDPVSSLKQMASQYGLTMAEAKAVQDAQTNGWEPQTWDDVLKKARDEATDKVLNDLQPIINQVQQIKRDSIEKSLDSHCQENGLPDWRLHEDQMKKVLADHPSMVRDPILLYEMSLPRNVKDARAMQAAMKKMEAKTKGAQVSAGSNTNKTGSTAPDKGMSFSDAVKYAKAKLAENGVHEPRY
jgi:hypothetical protein